MADIKKQNIELMEKLEPKNVFRFFGELSNIPRGSGNELAVGKYIAETLKPYCDKVELYKDGTVYAHKKGSPGYENKKTILLQAHTDMVCVKKPESNHDFIKDPIELVVDKANDKILANGTTLGADDGLGVANMLAVFTDNNLEHAPLEGLFTAAEETIMGGANTYPANVITAKYFINLDHEDSNSYCIGCEGGTETCITINTKRQAQPELSQVMKLDITGGKSGHSGNEIKFKIANTHKIMVSLLHSVMHDYPISLISLDGGTYKNAIPAFNHCTIAVNPKDFDAIKKSIEDRFALIKLEFNELEKTLKLDISKGEAKFQPIEHAYSEKVIHALDAMFNGIASMNFQYKISDGSSSWGLVKTEEKFIQLDFLTRSLYAVLKERIVNQIKAVFYGLDFTSKQVDDFPEWTPVIGSNIVQDEFIKIYKKVFGKEPVPYCIEGGLETGVITKKTPGIIGISIGSNIERAHTFEENASISKVGITYNILLDLIKNLD